MLLKFQYLFKIIHCLFLDYIKNCENMKTLIIFIGPMALNLRFLLDHHLDLNHHLLLPHHHHSLQLGLILFQHHQIPLVLQSPLYQEEDG